MSICSICQSTPLAESASLGQLGKLDCTHAFCFSCIRTWTHESTTCPNCNSPVTELIRCSSTDVLECVTLQLVDKRQNGTFRVEELQNEANALERCAVCDQEDDVDAIICDACGRYFHLECLPSKDVPHARHLCNEAVAAQDEAECLGLPEPRPTPEWFCPDCRSTAEPVVDANVSYWCVVS